MFNVYVQFIAHMIPYAYWLEITNPSHSITQFFGLGLFAVSSLLLADVQTPLV